MCSSTPKAPKIPPPPAPVNGASNLQLGGGDGSYANRKSGRGRSDLRSGNSRKPHEPKSARMSGKPSKFSAAVALRKAGRVSKISIAAARKVIGNKNIKTKMK